VKDRKEKTHLAHAFIAFNQAMDSFDGQKALVHVRILVARVEDVWRNNGGEIVDVHLASGVFVHGAEGRCPVKEVE
jgi:hypothetical protein